VTVTGTLPSGCTSTVFPSLFLHEIIMQQAHNKKTNLFFMVTVLFGSSNSIR
jgi:hypothetical protein